jgi:very-short-patch-repair endonuclease
VGVERKVLPKKIRRQYRDELNKKNFASEAWFEKILKKNGIFSYRRNECLLLRYFGDFVFKQQRLVVELDGSSHNGKEEYDAQRDAKLRKAGFKVIRIKFPDLTGQTERFLEEFGPRLKSVQKRGRQKALPKKPGPRKAIIQMYKVQNAEMLKDLKRRTEEFNAIKKARKVKRTHFGCS